MKKLGLFAVFALVSCVPQETSPPETTYRKGIPFDEPE